MTIAEAARLVLKSANQPLTVKQIYGEIVKQNLFQFGAKSPISVVSSTLRKNSDAPSETRNPIFHYHGNGAYSTR